MTQTKILATFAASIVLGAITFLSISSTAGVAQIGAATEGKLVCSLKKGNTTIKISADQEPNFGDMEPNPTNTSFKQINGGGWSKMSGTAQANCAKYRAKGYM